MLRWVSLRRAHLPGRRSRRGLGHAAGMRLGAVPFSAARGGGGNDWWPLNRKWLAARGLSEGPVGTAASRCRMAVARSVDSAERGRRYVWRSEGGRGPRIARRACTRLEGRPRAAVGAESGAAPRLFGSAGSRWTAQGRLQSWGPARGGHSPGSSGSGWRGLATSLGAG